MKCFIDLQISVETNKEKCGKEEIGERKEDKGERSKSRDKRRTETKGKIVKSE